MIEDKNLGPANTPEPEPFPSHRFGADADSGQNNYSGVSVTANIAEEKMRAISDLASAVKALAQTLASAQVNATITNCTFHGGGLKIGETY